jgi:hypothetical protein
LSTIRVGSKAKKKKTGRKKKVVATFCFHLLGVLVSAGEVRIIDDDFGGLYQQFTDVR